MNKFLLSVSRILPFPLFFSTICKDIIFPFYHLVSDNSPIHIKHLYSIKNQKNFISDLDFFLKKYSPISLDDFVEGRYSKKSFLLTFDDGLVEIYDVIAPILKQKGIPAVFFVNSAFVDNADLFFRYKASIIIDEVLKDNAKSKIANRILNENNLFKNNITESLLGVNFFNHHVLDEIYKFWGGSFKRYMQKTPVYLTSNQILSLQQQGFDIGAHSVNHPRYKNISLEHQLFQTVQSLKFVRENFNTKHNIFAFPFTDYGVSAQFFDKLFSSVDVNYTFGTAGLKKDVISKNVQRIPMETGNSAKQTLKYQYFVCLLRSILNKNIVKR